MRPEACRSVGRQALESSPVRVRIMDHKNLSIDDTQAVHSIVTSLYESLSGPAGEERDWSRLASLLFPGARLIRTWISPDGTPEAKVMDLQDYKDDTAEYFRHNAFYEAEVAFRIDRSGNIAHVLSAYESRHDPEDAHPFKRGINSIQLFHNGCRWCVINVLWSSEREGDAGVTANSAGAGQ